MPRTYQLTLSARQAGLMATALAFWSRCNAGQLADLDRLGEPASAESLAAARDAIASLRHSLFPSLAPGAGDYRYPGGLLAHNLRKVLEHGVSWDKGPPQGGTMTTNYDSPLAAWWEGEPPAVMLRWEGDEAVRIRDEANQRMTLGAELERALGTKDIDEATRRVLTWKAAYDAGATPPVKNPS